MKNYYQESAGLARDQRTLVNKEKAREEQILAEQKRIEEEKLKIHIFAIIAEVSDLQAE